MKTKTHNIFTAGVLTAAGSLFTVPVYALISGVIISYAANHLIDAYGHERNGLGMPARTYRTHSPLRAFYWGFAPSVILFVVVYYLNSWYSFLPAVPYFILIQGFLAGQTHLLLDLPTEGGIFINKKRFALGHFAYNNPLVNFAGVVIGVGFIYLSFTGGNYAKDFYSIRALIFNRI